MLADVVGNLLTLVVMGVHENPLDEVIAVLVASNIDERNAWTIWVSRGNDPKVAIKKLDATDLEALLNDLGSKLIDAVAVGVDKDMIDDTTFVGRRAMLAEMLDAPITKLAMSNEVNADDHFFDSRTLLFLNAVLEDVLNDQTASLTESNLVPHASKSFVDFEHDLRWLTGPAKLEQLLPDMACITVDDSVRDASKQLTNHVSLVILRDRVKGLLDDVTAEGIHAEGKHIAVDGVGDGNDLLRCAMLEAALNEEVTETVNHERIRLVNDGADNLELLLSSADLELLLQEDGGLLIVAANNFVHDVLPVAGDSLVKQATVIHGFKRSNISRVGYGWRHVLANLSATAEYEDTVLLTGDQWLMPLMPLIFPKSGLVGDICAPMGRG